MEEYLLICIRLSILFIVITCFGFAFIQKVIKENNIVYIIPLSIGTGFAYYTILTHLCALIFDLKNSVVISLITLVLCTLMILLKYKNHNKLIIEPGIKEFVALLIFSIFLALMSLFYLLYFNTYDPTYQHAAVIAKQTAYPPMNPYNPEAPLVYHYGVILLGAVLQILTNISPWNCYIPIQTIFIFTTPLAIFALLFFCTKNFTQSILGTIIGCFCSNLMSLSLLTSTGLIEAMYNIHQKLSFMNESGFAVATSKALMSPNTSVAIPLSITTILALIKYREAKRLFVLVPLLALIFFSYEGFWLPVIFIVCSIEIISAFKNKEKYNYLKIIATLFILIVLPLVLTGGGILGHKDSNTANLVYFDLKPYIYSWSGQLNQFYSYEWFKNHEIVSHRDGLRFYKIPFFSKYFFMELGLPIILLPLILIWLFKKKNVVLILLATSGLISLSLPFFISYIPREIETIRFLTYAKIIFAILLGIFIGYLLNIKLKPILNILVKITLGILITILVLPGIVWLIPKKYADYDYRYTQIPPEDKKALKWLSKKIQPGERGIGPIDIPHNNFDLITLSGAYGVGIAKQALFEFEGETRKTALETLNPCLLKELKVKWVYLNDKLLSKISPGIIEKLTSENLLVLRYKNNDKSCKIYEFILGDTKEYCINTNYGWAVGRMYDGRFYHLIDLNTNKPMIFPDKNNAFAALNNIIKSLDTKEAYWYRVEAIKTLI